MDTSRYIEINKVGSEESKGFIGLVIRYLSLDMVVSICGIRTFKILPRLLDNNILESLSVGQKDKNGIFVVH